MTTDAFAKNVADWFSTATHPVQLKPYGKLVYQPLIVSGGGIEFMRVFLPKRPMVYHRNRPLARPVSSSMN